MPEFEPDEESVSRARRLSSRLTDALRDLSKMGPSPKARPDLFSEERYEDAAEGVPVGDVVTTVGRMAGEFALARRWDGQVLCTRLGDEGLVPVSISELLGGPSPAAGPAAWLEMWEWYGHPPLPPPHLWQEVLRRRGEEEEPFVMADVDETTARVEKGLGRFLSYRFAALKHRKERTDRDGPSPRRPSDPVASDPPPPAVGPDGGLQVQVSCRTPGLRLHVAPAYFITWVFFGHPTTPVTGYVLPGRYVFAGDGPMLPRRRTDPAVFSIPPTFSPALTRF